MPRETVTRDVFQLEVTWGHDTHVQLGLRTSHSDKTSSHLVPQLYQRRATDVGKAASQAIFLKPEPEKDYLKIGESVLRAMQHMAPEFDSLWCDLDRHEINKLIKVLRRARDAAYGKDE